MENIFVSLPIWISLLLSVFLIFKKKETVSTKMLGLFFFLLTTSLSIILLLYLKGEQSHINKIFAIFETLFYVCMLCLPPVYFFYVISLTGGYDHPKIPKYIIPHFFIPLQVLLFNLYIFWDGSISNSQDVSFLTDFVNFFSLKVIFVLSNVYYLSISFFLYHKNRSMMRYILASESGISMQWLGFFTLGYLSFVFCFFFLDLNASPYVIYIPIFLFATYWFFQRKNQFPFLVRNSLEFIYENEVSFEEIPPKKVLNPSNTPNPLLKKLQVFMDKEKPYLKKDLNIYELAKMMETNAKVLSETINRDFEANFTSFINTYRVQTAKDLLLSDAFSKLTIEAISKEAGFHSKSAFNKAFKSMERVTPSVYRKKHQPN